MSKVSIMVCVNSYNNGMFSGELSGVHLFDKNNEFLSLWAFEGLKCNFNWEKKLFIVEGQEFPYYRYKQWYGNWCWDLIIVDLTSAKKLLRLLKERWGPDCPDMATELGERIWKDICIDDQPGQTKLYQKIEEIDSLQKTNQKLIKEWEKR